ncbi:hypothetical protein [uncultured Roseobacter sp.]|uniref:phosphatase domain-containing putative toxin n=1 Tax=uncultured Roseobacter sp. TaxID=114847 RepID=UPI00260D9F2F|nr:hypothetical protein [uncultured Roseobacter sp.]
MSTKALLQADAERLRDHNVGLVLSCICAQELPLGVPAYSGSFGQFGISWVLLPIRDMSVPDAVTEPLVADAMVAARAVCKTGSCVAIHCKAGLGRTGMIAARLATTYGLTGAEAIAFIRRQHSAEAVETAEQEAYVIGLERVPAHTPE